MGRPLKVVVSGSFRRQLNDVAEAVSRFRGLGHDVLSPAEPAVVDRFGDFLYVASDKTLLISAVQGRHFASIDRADLLWVACNDGYTGPSTSAEIGYALRAGIPIFVPTAPDELQWRPYVVVVSGTEEAIRQRREMGQGEVETGVNVLMDPMRAAEFVSDQARELAAGLTSKNADPEDDMLERSLRTIRKVLQLPGRSRAS